VVGSDTRAKQLDLSSIAYGTIDQLSDGSIYQRSTYNINIGGNRAYNGMNDSWRWTGGSTNRSRDQYEGVVGSDGYAKKIISSGYDTKVGMYPALFLCTYSTSNVGGGLMSYAVNTGTSEYFTMHAFIGPNTVLTFAGIEYSTEGNVTIRKYVSGSGTWSASIRSTDANKLATAFIVSHGYVVCDGG
jgi:hypothetical protein